MTEWQPIETAPRNGTLVIIWDADEGAVNMASWQKYAWRLSDGDPVAASHWMPLPGMPADIVREREESAEAEAALIAQVLANLDSQVKSS